MSAVTDFAAYCTSVGAKGEFTPRDRAEQQRYEEAVQRYTVERAATRTVLRLRPRENAPRRTGSSGRPRAQASRSSAASGDSGDPDPPKPGVSVREIHSRLGALRVLLGVVRADADVDPYEDEDDDLDRLRENVEHARRAVDALLAALEHDGIPA
jgi:hypothetical protein